MFKFWTYLQLQGLSYLSIVRRKVVARENKINEQDVWSYYGRIILNRKSNPANKLHKNYVFFSLFFGYKQM